MLRWLRVLLGVVLILIPEPTLITDALGALIIVNALLPMDYSLSHRLGSCRCYYCVTGLSHPVTI